MIQAKQALFSSSESLIIFIREKQQFSQQSKAKGYLNIFLRPGKSIWSVRSLVELICNCSAPSAHDSEIVLFFSENLKFMRFRIWQPKDLRAQGLF